MHILGNGFLVLMEEETAAGRIASLIEKEACEANGEEVAWKFFDRALELRKKERRTFVPVAKSLPEKGMCG